MLVRSAILAAVVASASGMALGEEGPVLLTKAEVEAEILGTRLSGTISGSSLRWHECIEPDGDTLYELDGETWRGRMDVRDDGRACFRYDPSDAADANCFSVFRLGPHYVFHSETMFFADEVRRDVTQCFAEELVG